MLDARGVRDAREADRVVQRLGGRLLGVDVLAGFDRPGDGRDAGRGDLRVEVDRDRRVGEGLLQRGAPLLQTVLSGQRLDLLGVAADQDRLGPDRAAVGQGQAALFPDGEDGAQ